MSDRRLAIVGCGFIGSLHSLVLAGLARAGLAAATVVATCDHDVERARRAARGHASARATTRVQEAVSAADAVWVCTPTAGHLSAVELAARHGAALYVEKPLAPSLETAEAVARAAQHLPVQVGLVLRHSVPLGTLAAHLASGVAGAPMALTLRDDQYFPNQGQYASSWRQDVAVAGGGTLLEHSIHDLDLLAWLAGPVTSVGARTANFAGYDGVEDLAVVTLAHRRGATAALTSVWHGVLSRASSRRLEVLCHDAVYWLEDEAAGPLWLETSSGLEQLPLAWGPEPPEEAVEDALGLPEGTGRALSYYLRSDLAFLRALEATSAPSPGPEVALEAHRLVDAAYRSAAGNGVPARP